MCTHTHLCVHTHTFKGILQPQGLVKGTSYTRPVCVCAHCIRCPSSASPKAVKKTLKNKQSHSVSVCDGLDDPKTSVHSNIHTR